MDIKTLLLAVILLASLCFITFTYAGGKSDAQNAVEGAQLLWEQTIAAGHEWNTIRPLMAQAKQALKSEDFDKALALAAQASAQSKHALIQAEFEKINWVNNLPK